MRIHGMQNYGLARCCKMQPTFGFLHNLILNDSVYGNTLYSITWLWQHLITVTIIIIIVTIILNLRAV